jgi:hypothetical protein
LLVARCSLLVARCSGDLRQRELRARRATSVGLDLAFATEASIAHLIDPAIRNRTCNNYDRAAALPWRLEQRPPCARAYARPRPTLSELRADADRDPGGEH